MTEHLVRARMLARSNDPESRAPHPLRVRTASLGGAAQMRRRTQLRARASVLDGLPAGYGRDLIEVLYGGWLDRPLWENYGPVDADTAALGAADTNTERRLYVQVAEWALQAMQIAGAFSRAGTQYRIASAVIGELNGDQTRPCARCGGSGRHRTGREPAQCMQCSGRGLVLPSMSSRADACECRRPEFRDNLLGVYLTLLARLRRELGRAQRDYAEAETQTNYQSMPG